MPIDERDYMRNPQRGTRWGETHRGLPQWDPSPALAPARPRRRGRSNSLGWRRDSSGRISNGLALAVLVSGAVAFLNWTGYLSIPDIHVRGGAPATDARTILLGQSTGFDVVGPVGRQWCLTVPKGERVCAKTGTAESGRQALKRALETRGYKVK